MKLVLPRWFQACQILISDDGKHETREFFQAEFAIVLPCMTSGTIHALWASENHSGNWHPRTVIEGIIMTDIDPIDIRPEVSVMGVFRHLNYKPWFAIAEFVDNALESFLVNKRILREIEGHDFKLLVNIHIDPDGAGRLTVTDNAFGIASSDWSRALKPAEAPPQAEGLSEFGMGMKTAACWFGQELIVRSTAYGEDTERTARLNFVQIVDEKQNTIQPVDSPAPVREHGTVVVVDGLFKVPQTKTLPKIKDHLASIYRMFIRQGDIEISMKVGTSPAEILDLDDVPVLVAPKYDELAGDEIQWKKEISIDLGDGLSATGFAALRAEGSYRYAGFALFRNRRLIQGSADESYRPKDIFGSSNSTVYQRLFGELVLSGFEVSHTKDGFKWEENEEPFIELLIDELNELPLPLLTQARRYSYQLNRPQNINWEAEAEDSLSRTAGAIEVHLPNVDLDSNAERAEVPPPQALVESSSVVPRTINIIYLDREWNITIEFSNDIVDRNKWFEYSQTALGTPGAPVDLNVRVSLRNAFNSRFAGVEYQNLDLLLRFASAIAIAETSAREAGSNYPGDVRRRVNTLLTTVFNEA
jgi:hypothetical protein